MTNTYVIASTRLWDTKRTQQLAAKTGKQLVFIDSNSELTLEYLSELKPRYIFFPFWSHRIDKRIYEAVECVIFHMTDLPFGRGGSPLQNLIIRGISETKVSAIKCVEEFDAGPIYLQKDLALDGPAHEIYERAALLIESMIVEIIGENPSPRPQIGNATIFKRRNFSESNLATVTSLEKVYDMIRMLDADGYPHAFLEVGNMRLEFRNANLHDERVQADVSIVFSDHDGKKSK